MSLSLLHFGEVKWKGLRNSGSGCGSWTPSSLELWDGKISVLVSYGCGLKVYKALWEKGKNDHILI